MNNLIRINLLVVVILLVGCSPSENQVSTETPNPTIVFPTPVQTDDTDEDSAPLILKIWLPPDFDPNEGTEAGRLLKARLDEFSAQFSNTGVEVRIKNLDGPASLLESLSAAHEAAPSALPDLVALPADQMQFAASRRMIIPLESLIITTEEEDWYDFALDLGQYQGERYGIPFASDALVMAYHPNLVGELPGSWEDVLSMEDVLGFPAADPNAYYTLALYLSLGGGFFDENGNLQLDQALLESVFNFYLQAHTAGVMPDWLTQNDTDELTWGAFMMTQAHMVIIWSTYFFDQTTGGTSFTMIPTKDGTPFTLATGWVWALTGNDASRYPLAYELAEFLTEGEFLGEWTQAAGHLPPRASATAVWPQDPQAVASQILSSAVVVPDETILEVFGGLFSQAVIKVLNRESTPAEAVNEVLANLRE
jgi:multiple sugar transport system substrate-binding protein